MNMGNRMSKNNWYQSPYLWIGIALASMMPFAFASIPPLTDYPNHLARYYIFLNVADSPFLQNYYSLNWTLVGNLGVDLLVRMIGPWLGAETAARIVLSLIPPLTIAGIYSLSRALNGTVSPVALVATPLAYNYPLGIGLINFNLSAAIALLVLALWIRLRPRSIYMRFPLFAALGFVTWLAHTVGWGLLGLGVFGFELSRAFKERGLRVSTVFVAALQTAPFAVMAVYTAIWHTKHQANLGVLYVPNPVRSKMVQLLSLFRDYYIAWDIASAGIFGIVVVAFFWALGRKVLPSAAIICAFFMIAFVLVPPQIFHSGFIDRRILPFAFILLALSVGHSTFEPKTVGRARLVSVLAAISVAFFVMRMTVTTLVWASASASLENRLALLEKVPPQSRLFSLALDTCGKDWSRIGRPDHLQTMAVVRRNDIVNGLFQGDGFNQVNVRFHKTGEFDPNMQVLVRDETCAQAKDWPSMQWAIPRFPRDSFEYLWLMSEHPLPPFDETGLKLIASLGNDRIYSVLPANDVSSSQQSNGNSSPSPVNTP